MAAVARMRIINSDGGRTAGADGDRFAVLVKVSEQKKEDCLNDEPGWILKRFQGGTVCFVYFQVLCQVIRGRMVGG